MTISERTNNKKMLWIDRHHFAIRDPVCHCGRKKSRHKQSSLTADLSTTDWTPERCTKPLPTNAYGEIDFQGTGSQKRAPVSSFTVRGSPLNLGRGLGVARGGNSWQIHTTCRREKRSKQWFFKSQDYPPSTNESGLRTIVSLMVIRERDL